MLTKEQTKLEVFGFSDQPEDLFYCLLDLTNKSAGIDLRKLSSTKPEKLDEALNEMGCLVLLSKKDIDKVLNGSDNDHDELHDKLYQWALEEDMV
ncbi:MAG: hypothetical protein WD266_03830 [Balneolales bacterium]